MIMYNDYGNPVLNIDNAVSVDINSFTAIKDLCFEAIQALSLKDPKKAHAIMDKVEILIKKTKENYN